MRVDPESGKMEPMATGLRSPAGIESSPDGEIFYTDNQGEWCNASKLSHLSHGEFHGHPHGLPTIEQAGEPFSKIPSPKSGTYMKDLHETIPQFKMPAVWFPYNKTGRSPAGMAWDTTKGAFGPFAGPLFVTDHYDASIVRVCLEEVAGNWQGACIPFRMGFQCGTIRCDFGPDGSLLVGMTNRGWGGRGNSPYGLQRLRWTGETRPSGCSTTRSTDRAPAKARTAAAPVSPEVAVRIVSRSPEAARASSVSAATSCMARSLNAAVGP